MAYRSFYVIAIFELVVNIAVSSRWKVVSFKGTHLTQRMSLLTLIIIGEGVIVTCKTISKLVTYHDAWNAETVGCVIASVMIIVSHASNHIEPQLIVIVLPLYAILRCSTPAPLWLYPTTILGLPTLPTASCSCPLLSRSLSILHLEQDYPGQGRCYCVSYFFSLEFSKGESANNHHLLVDSTNSP